MLKFAAVIIKGSVKSLHHRVNLTNSGAWSGQPSPCGTTAAKLSYLSETDTSGTYCVLTTATGSELYIYIHGRDKRTDITPSATAKQRHPLDRLYDGRRHYV
jgi:hypothetical protein